MLTPDEVDLLFRMYRRQESVGAVSSTLITLGLVEARPSNDPAVKGFQLTPLGDAFVVAICNLDLLSGPRITNEELEIWVNPKISELPKGQFAAPTAMAIITDSPKVEVAKQQEIIRAFSARGWVFGGITGFAVSLDGELLACIKFVPFHALSLPTTHLTDDNDT